MTKNENNSKKFKNIAPWAALIILTLVLMVFFKLSEQGYSNLKVKGENLIAKYGENLSPFFVNSELTNEDVFNFALYNNLPIDKSKNKVLSIESDSYGNENYVISEIDSLPKTNNYDLYKLKLGLSGSEKNKIDSILDHYIEDLYASILVSDNQTIALDPKISLIQKAIGTDIYKFALQKKTESNSAGEKNYAVRNKDKLANAIKDKENKPAENYIFFAPDTVFRYDFAVNKKKMTEEIKSLEKESGQNRKKLDWMRDVISKKDLPDFALNKLPEDEYNYQFDSNWQKLTLPASYYFDNKLLDYDSLKWSLDNLADDISSFQFGLKGYEKGLKIFVESNDGNKLENVEIDFNFENLGDFISNTISAATSASPEDWEKFGAEMDSLSKSFSDLENDSTAFIRLKKATEELKKAQKQKKQKR